MTPTIDPGAVIPDIAAKADDVRHVVALTGVVRIKDGPMSAAEFVALMGSLGPLMFTDGETPVPDHPDLNIVTNVGRKTKPRSQFHSDTTYVQRPPSYSGLIAIDVPQAGGATCFLDQHAAYDALPSTMKELLIGATMQHNVTGVSVPPDAETQARYPVLRKHPDTGRTAIYLTTPERCSDLILSTGEDRSDLIAWLYNHSTTQPAKAHAWQPGDIIVWDNRCTLHAADHSDVVGDRTLYRALVRGEAPLAADELVISSDMRPDQVNGAGR
ncbi:MAG: TauD/TfdA family dioxygenase [Pseudomonadota bacterium]